MLKPKWTQGNQWKETYFFTVTLLLDYVFYLFIYVLYVQTFVLDLPMLPPLYGPNLEVFFLLPFLLPTTMWLWLWSVARMKCYQKPSREEEEGDFGSTLAGLYSRRELSCLTLHSKITIFSAQEKRNRKQDIMERLHDMWQYLKGIKLRVYVLRFS